MPAIAAVAGGDHPNAELLELGREYMDLDEAIKAADAIVEAYRKQEPEPRDVMRHRIEDHLYDFGLPMIDTCRRGISSDNSQNESYSEAEIDCLGFLSPPHHPDWIGHNARVEEILAEWDRWTEECGALNETLGVDKAVEAVEDLVPKHRALAKRIAEMPATTLAGVQVRAMILAEMLDEEEVEDGCTDQLCRNLGDAARSGGVVYRRFEDLDAVFESDTCDNLRQVICAFQPSPGFRCGDDQLKHHQPGGR